ncbi:MAG: hypothetical protein BWY44_00803 [Candidatus Omnitrophica bacterium ADurb.Bin292]|jgi:hypothetical protein|nr:MAG: hypothetical protein BWY44_00803 [Candidatus Omnitrophica bacterium ADurb.Bin292]
MTDNRQFLLYTAPDGAVQVEVCFRDESVWLTQKALAELFGVKVPAINKHLRNIFESGELVRETTVSKMEIVRPEGAREVAREAERGIITQMTEWVEFLNHFLELSNYPILNDKGKVSALEAKLKAEAQYEVFRQRQDREYISDFDREIRRLEGKK